MKLTTEQEKKEYEERVAANILTIINKGYKDKYDHYGIYCIKVDNKIVYIGKSRNMLKRIAQHMAEIDCNTDKNMYNVLRELRPAHSIAFDALLVTKDDDDEMGFAEARAIRHYQPCLNIQYPKLDNYHSFEYRRLAKHITAKQVEEFLDNDK